MVAVWAYRRHKNTYTHTHTHKHTHTHTHTDIVGSKNNLNKKNCTNCRASVSLLNSGSKRPLDPTDTPYRPNVIIVAAQWITSDLHDNKKNTVIVIIIYTKYLCTKIIVIFKCYISILMLININKLNRIISLRLLIETNSISTSRKSKLTKNTVMVLNIDSIKYW